MKCFLFFVLLHLFAQTCYGVGNKKIDQLHIVFISNMVDPNEYEMETLTNVMAYPFIKGSNASLISHFGLVVNYTIILSSEPDTMITLRALDMEHYSIDYFQSLVKKYAANSCKGATLKSLQKALEISSSPSMILMATNKRPKDTVLMIELLETIISKMNPVIVFQIAKDGSISKIPTGKYDVNINYYIPEYFEKNDVRLMQEYETISEVTKDILFVFAFEKMIKEMDAIRHPYMLMAFPKISNTFPTSVGKRSAVFVYDVVNATENELDEASRTMEIFYQKKVSSYNVTNSHSMVFSSQPETIITLENLINYTAKDFRAVIVNQTNGGIKKSTLKSLRNALRFAQPFSLIVCFVKDIPEDNHELLLEVIQLIMDKSIIISIMGYPSKEKMPVLYRTIYDASTIGSGGTNVELVYVKSLILVIALAQGKKLFVLS